MYSAYGAANQGPVGPYRTLDGAPPLASYGYGECKEQQPLACNLPMKPGSPFVRAQRKSLNFIMAAASLFIPWIVFVAIMSIEGFSLHYSSASTCGTLSMIILFMIVCFLLLAVNAWRKGQSEGLQDPTWLVVLFATCLIAWFVGMASGHGIYYQYMLPYFEVNALNTYQSVDPALYEGQQLMDAGRITFTPGTHLDLKHSMGFRNMETYCVSPIVSGNTAAAGNSSEMPSFDFWAVGLNCCSGHKPDFHCGEYNNPSAKSGLRLMDDYQRAYFRLAVQQAEAAYNINAGHPIFVYWMQDTVPEINAFQDAATNYFLLGLFAFFAYQFVITVVAAIVVAKVGA